MRIFKIYSLSNFQIVLIINFNHRAVRYISMTYLFYNWIFFSAAPHSLQDHNSPTRAWTRALGIEKHRVLTTGWLDPWLTKEFPTIGCFTFSPPFTHLTPSSPYTHFSVCFHPSVDTLDCIHILVIVNSAAVNIGVRISFQVSVLGIFFDKYPEVKLLDHVVVLFLNF